MTNPLNRINVVGKDGSMKGICFFNVSGDAVSIKVKRLLIAIITLLIIGVIGISIYINRIIEEIPENICVPCNEETVVNLKIPAYGRFTGVCNNSEDNINFENTVNLDLSKPVTIMADKIGNYNMQLKLFGLVDIADLNINVVDETYVYVGGFQVGFYMKAEGILVVDCQSIKDINGNTCSPCEGILQKGDSIVAVDDINVTSKNEFNEYILNSNRESVKITFIRENQLLSAYIMPVECANNTKMIGLWIKDDAQGIGTVTYVNKDGYAALGHGVNDVNTEKFLKISGGEIYNTRIMSIVKGDDGKPGEYIGTIDYSKENRLGTVDENVSTGIYGDIESSVIDDYNMELMQIAYNSQIKTGEAFIRVYDNSKYNDYRIKINKLSYEGERNISFQVVDDKLLDKTNGIVQGMSGSPIIQDGKIVGAVTHVLVNDPTRGYGIFIENMLDAAGKKSPS